ncbi:MAG: glycosyltransferase family protein [archaeon]
MKILFAVNSVGLGHATRCVPLIEGLIEKKNEVTILSSFRALQFLKEEFGSKVTSYFDVKDYATIPELFAKGKFTINEFIVKSPKLMKDFLKEQRQFNKISKKFKYDRIISDSRFGIYTKGVPTFMLAHHIKLGIDFNAKLSETVTELFYYTMRHRYKNIIIPDFKNNGIGGELCHNFRFFSGDYIKFIGMTSMVKKLNVPEDVDYFFSVSGPEPQRTVFEKKVLAAVPKIKGNIVITLGKPETKKYVKKGNVEIYDCLNREKQTEYLNRAKLVITRSGYTTLMDLAELGKKALLIPTEAQPEQEYLSEYHMKMKTWYSVELKNLELTKDLKIAQAYDGYKAEHFTKKSVQNFLRIVSC